MLSAKLSRELKKERNIHSVHCRLEIHVALSTLNNDVRILAQGCYVAIISLFLL